MFIAIERVEMKAKRALCKYCLIKIANNGSRKIDNVIKFMNVLDEVKLKLPLKGRYHEPNQSNAMASKSSQIVNMISQSDLSSNLMIMMNKKISFMTSCNLQIKANKLQFAIFFSSIIGLFGSIHMN